VSETISLKGQLLRKTHPGRCIRSHTFGHHPTEAPPNMQVARATRSPRRRLKTRGSVDNRNSAEIAEPSSAPVSSDVLTRAVVVDALQHLVDSGLAIWRRNSHQEIELQLLSGAVFALGETGLTRV
jgi:hypothetical protein